MTHRLLPLIVLGLIARTSEAQGITTSAVQGIVVAVDGSPIAAATVRLTNTANGLPWEMVTNHRGRFLHAAIPIGTYKVDVRAMGFAAQTHPAITLVLGHPHAIEFTLVPLAAELTPVTVTASRDHVLDPGRTGPTDVIDRSTLTSLPNVGRGFVGITLLSPQVVSSVQTPATAAGSGIAFDGQNRMYNSFQIDGGVHQDLYRGQLPGRESFPRPVSLEAIEEIQVLAAPFEVRHGGFAGGAVNAVTRSGTNTVHGSLFGYLSDDALVRRGGAGGAVGEFRTWQFGGTVGGPIVRNRAHYFLSVDVQRRIVPDPGPFITDTVGGADMEAIGISYASAARMQAIFDTLYGIDVGTLGPVNGHVPAQDVFAKLTATLARNNHIEWSLHQVRGDRRDFLLRTKNYYALSSFAQAEPSTTRASRVVWTSVPGGRWSNELIVGFMSQRDSCRPASLFPQVRVTTSPGAFITAGTAGGCAPSTVRQEAIEVTDNAATAVGRHVLGVGFHGELLRFRDDLMIGSPGLWIFESLDALEAGRAQSYQRTLRGPAWSGGIDFRAYHFALYAQDRWTPRDDLTLTAGVRVDLPLLPDPVPTNESLVGALGYDTGRPTGNALWSPRIGINYDVGGRGHTFVRGGAGLFAGRAPYRWFSNAYRDDGTREQYLDCRGPNTPAFTPLDQPTTCVSTGPRPQLSLFDPDVTVPQNMKVALGLDRRLTSALVGTLDVLFTRAVRQLYVTDANLAAPSAVAAGEADRPMYGKINPTNGVATPTPINTALGQVVRVSNRSGDQSLSISGQLRARFGDAISGHALYSFTRARDRMSIVHIAARPMLGGTVLDGTHEHRRLATSLFEIPHRLQVTTDLRLPYGARLGLVYAGASGRPFTYTVQGDPNADGLGISLRQDPVYVPRDRADIAIDGNGVDAGFGTVAEQKSRYRDLDAFIESTPCLREQRGRVLARNSCRNPWFGTINARLTKEFPTTSGHSFEVAADIYNVLNLLSSRWGLARYDGLTFATDLLELRGYDTTAGRGVYAVRVPPRNQIDDLASRWQTEISVRYRF